MSKYFCKRIFDIICSSIFLIFLSPIFLLIALAIKLDSIGPVFFRQKRVGQHGQYFYIHKFRTMVANAEQIGLPLTIINDPRITRVGIFLRRYKLDEFAQLIDVFMGKMSFVGPRPEVPKYVECYPLELKNIILSLKPGITDNASIFYHLENDLLNSASSAEKIYLKEILPKKLQLNVDYVKHWTFCGDLKIILKTLFTLYKC